MPTVRKDLIEHAYRPVISRSLPEVETFLDTGQRRRRLYQEPKQPNLLKISFWIWYI
jgi:hypothetical protein